VNIDALAELLPEVSLENPTPEAIAECYRTLLEYHDTAVRSREEIDQLTSDLEKATLERDQALQDSESSKAELETTLETTQGELRQVKQEKMELSEYLFLAILLYINVY
jgi:multidrug resistance efflux pump